MLLLTIFLTLLSIIDVGAIAGGLFEIPIPFYYWYTDAEGVLLLFRNKDMDISERSFLANRNWIVILSYFSAICSITNFACASRFRMRRYGASQWPLTFWKVATFLMTMRFMSVCIAMYKFHFEMINLDDTADYIEIYKEGTIGSIPILLLGSIAVNLFVVLRAIKSIYDISEWRRLNIAKCL